MKTCTFLATKEPTNVAVLRSRLYDLVVDLIEEEGVRNFYVGYGDDLNSVFYDVLDKIGEFYEDVFCCVILPDENIPNEIKNKNNLEWACPTIVIKTPTEFAVKVRDLWLKDISDIIILYGKKPKGLRGKRIIEI